MRPLPRVLVLTTDQLCRAADFGIRAAAIASAGSSMGLVVRAPASTAAQHAAFTERVMSLARPPEAAVLVHARPDLARTLGADGVQLRAQDLSPRDARLVLGPGWIGRSVHSEDEARVARDTGADYLVAGNVFETPTHPDRPARGLPWLAGIVRLGLPVLAIGGITPARAAGVRDAGAWGAAVIRAAWDADDPAAAAAQLLEPWSAS